MGLGAVLEDFLPTFFSNVGVWEKKHPEGADSSELGNT